MPEFIDDVEVNVDGRIECIERCFRSALCRASRLPGGGVGIGISACSDRADTRLRLEEAFGPLVIDNE